LRLHVVGFGGLDLVVSGGELALCSDNARVGVGDVRCGGTQLAGGVDRSDGHGDIQRLRGGFGVFKIGLGLGDGNFIVFGVNLNEDGALLDPLVIIHIDLDNVAGNARADGVKVDVGLGIVRGFVAAEVAPQKYAANEQHRGGQQNKDVSAALGFPVRRRSGRDVVRQDGGLRWRFRARSQR
jgi:hypothetical protein